MLTFQYKRGILRFTETYKVGPVFDVKNTDVQIHSWLQVPKDKPAPTLYKKNPFTIHRLFRTVVIDLQQSADEIFKDMSTSTRYNINRAKRDGVTYSEITNPTDEEINDFVDFYSKFAKIMGISSCVPAKLKSMRDNNAVVLTMVKHNDKPLCRHCYIFDGDRAIMIHSASDRINKSKEELSFIARSNRLLHWSSMLSFKEKGCRWYDFCGLNLDPKNKKGQGINEFKKGFGGFQVDEFKTYRGGSFFGKLTVFLLSLNWRNNPEFVRANKLYRSNVAGYE